LQVLEILGPCNGNSESASILHHMDEYDDEVEAVHQSVLKKRELGIYLSMHPILPLHFTANLLILLTLFIGSLRSKGTSSSKKHSSSPLYSLPLLNEQVCLKYHSGKR
jgi:hypothetical protein